MKVFLRKLPVHEIKVFLRNHLNGLLSDFDEIWHYAFKVFLRKLPIQEIKVFLRNHQERAEKAKRQNASTVLSRSGGRAIPL